MTYGMDDVTFTSTNASATAEVQLNSGTSLSAPDPAHAFNAVVPYQMELGAFTVDESLLTAFRIQTEKICLTKRKHRRRGFHFSSRTGTFSISN